MGMCLVSSQICAAADRKSNSSDAKASLTWGCSSKRVWGGFAEPIENPNQIDEILLDDVVVDTGDFSVSSTGLLTFDTAPADGVVVKASFSYYYRCRFETDTTDFKEFSPQLFSHDDFAFRGSVVNKV